MQAKIEEWYEFDDTAEIWLFGPICDNMDLYCFSGKHRDIKLLLAAKNLIG